MKGTFDELAKMSQEIDVQCVSDNTRKSYACENYTAEEAVSKDILLHFFSQNLSQKVPLNLYLPTIRAIF